MRNLIINSINTSLNVFPTLQEKFDVTKEELQSQSNEELLELYDDIGSYIDKHYYKL